MTSSAASDGRSCSWFGAEEMEEMEEAEEMEMEILLTTRCHTPSHFTADSQTGEMFSK